MTAYDDTSRIGKEAMDGALKSVSAMTRGFQMLASETGDYTKRSYEQSTELMEKMTQVRTLDKVFELQADYAKAAYEGWVSQATKMSEICSDMARESYKPFEGVMNSFPKPQAFKA
ncbi:phasin family protein [Aureimonas altamirensis]|uniref:phasin family protein n=1 Tax=Aureimonas altamirensis TaxID=370622 RepID=UPI001E5A3541|nr:phasin family protein [Aureimonas altamirensis]UHD44368.1 phasin family protein [Aureimonas altamirensis]